MSQTGGGRILTGIVLAAVSGALAAFAAPPYPASFLIFVAFVPMVVAQYRLLPGRSSALAPGITYGVWFASQLLPGMVEARVALVVQLLPVYAALTVSLLSLRTRRFHEETRYRWFWIATPLGWVALDFLRGSKIAVLGGTWGNPVYALWAHPWFLQPLSVFGSYGLELLILATNWVVAGVIIAVLDIRSQPSPQPFPLGRAMNATAGLAGVFALWTILSLVMFDSAPPVLKAAAIQPGPGDATQELRFDIEQTREAAAAGARLIVWREAGLRFDPRKERSDEIGALAREAKAWLVAGFAARTPDGRRLNMAAVFSPDGRLVGAYGKDHPGTFAGDYSDEQVGYPVWNTEFGGLAVIICYDLDFTDTARYMARGGAGMIAVPSNDPVPSLAETHYTHLVFRAIENRVSLIKADKMRDAAAIDPWGRVVAKEVDRDGRRSTLIADLPWGAHAGVYVSLGDWMGWVSLGAFLVLRLTIQVKMSQSAADAVEQRDKGRAAL